MPLTCGGFVCDPSCGGLRGAGDSNDPSEEDLECREPRELVLVTDTAPGGVEVRLCRELGGGVVDRPGDDGAIGRAVFNAPTEATEGPDWCWAVDVELRSSSSLGDTRIVRHFSKYKQYLLSTHPAIVSRTVSSRSPKTFSSSLLSSFE